MEEKKYLKWYNKIGYGSGDVAGNVVYAFLTSFIMVYLTDSVGLAAGVVGTLIAVSKLFDGFTDIFFGSMIDKTHSKMGKAKPWMLYGYIGCAITLVSCFAVPVSLGTTAKYAYGIAFSKEWGEKNNLQPIHYLNEQSQYTRYFSEIVEQVLNTDNVSDAYVDDILDRLCFIKPLRGIMKRKNKKETGEEIEIEFQKNFHDEKEWRYVPGREAVRNTNIERVVANQYLLEMDINSRLSTRQYEKLWLLYNYEDIRYIIVPNASERIDFINTILNIPEEQFTSESDIMTQKYILISKILVLAEIRKDW